MIWIGLGGRPARRWKTFQNAACEHPAADPDANGAAEWTASTYFRYDPPPASARWPCPGESRAEIAGGCRRSSRRFSPKRELNGGKKLRHVSDGIVMQSHCGTIKQPANTSARLQNFQRSLLPTTTNNTLFVALQT